MTRRLMNYLFPLVLLLIIGSASGKASAQSPPIVDRDSSAVILAHEETVSGFGSTWELDFYRNLAYDCGLSGNYTFLVMNPANSPDAQAPLWVYLHGGGVGYFDDQGGYHAVNGQTQDTWNHEETFENLWDDQILRRTVDGGGQQIDNTLSRRIMEGYRLLVVSMSDHDLYSGLGTPYPNNPNGGEVNGLQATMAAVDYTVAHYPTTHVFAHGTSAGSIGVFSLAIGYAAEGTALTGVVADSSAFTPRTLPIFAAFAGVAGFPFPGDFDPQGVIDKIGVLADPDLPFFPEAMVSNGFDDAPVLFIGGDADPFSAGNQPPIAEAVAAGLNNADWKFDGLRQAVANQPDSPHQVTILDGAGHVPTNLPGVANDIVDDFIGQILSTGPPYPFTGDSLPAVGWPALGALAAAIAIAGGAMVRRRYRG